MQHRFSQSAVTLSCSLWAAFAAAQASEPPNSAPTGGPAARPATPRPAATQPAAEAAAPPLEVTVDTVRGDWDLRLGKRRARDGRFAGTSDELDEIPGVSSVHRGAAAGAPVLRGQGFERVATQLGPVPLFGACPGQMDPPVQYLRPAVAEELQLSLVLPSVTLGPAGTAGRVEAPLDRPPEGRRKGGSLGMTYDGARRGGIVHTDASYAARPVDARVAFEAQQFGDYEGADGSRVPARATEVAAATDLGIELGRNLRLYQRFAYGREQNVDYPALPMDLVVTDSFAYAGGLRFDHVGGRLESLVLESGFTRINHTMDNAGKPNRMRLAARTDARVRTLGSSAELTWDLSLLRLVTGSDLSWVRRDALRHRTLVQAQRSFDDPLWPDARQTTTGLFAEARFDRWEHWSLRVGGRLDYVTSRARAANDPGLMGLTPREHFERFHGDVGDWASDEDLMGSGNALVTWSPEQRLDLYAGAGTSTRSPGITERFFVFAPAPGGFQLGNPNLDPERKVALEVGGRWHGEWLGARLGGYAHFYDGYILPTAIGREDIDGDGSDDTLRSYENVGARLIGAELQATLRLPSGFSLPTQFGAVHGQNTSAARPLPEVPPWELRAALRFSRSERHPWFVEAGGRLVGAQRRVDANYPEDETPSWFTLHARAGVDLWRRLSLVVGLENLLDAAYHEHLTREAALPVGDLEAGGEIPAPGRYGYGAVRFEY